MAGPNQTRAKVSPSRTITFQTLCVGRSFAVVLPSRAGVVASTACRGQFDLEGSTKAIGRAISDPVVGCVNIYLRIYCLGLAHMPGQPDRLTRSA